MGAYWRGKVDAAAQLGIILDSCCEGRTVWHSNTYAVSSDAGMSCSLTPQLTVGSFLTAVVKDSHMGATLSRSLVFIRVKPPT